MKKSRNREKRVRITSKDSFWGYVFIAVPMLLFLLFTVYPVISAVITSFMKYKPKGSVFIGIQNYVNTFKTDLFYKAFKNTIVFSITSVPISILMSFMISIIILPFRKKIQSVYKGIFYLPAVASGVALAFVWKWIIDSMPNGLLNNLVGFFHIPAQNWLGSRKTAMLSLVIMSVVSGLGQNIIIYMAAILNVDPSFYEAADVDGARFWDKLRFILWPLVKPTTVFLAITGVINGFQAFQNAYLMTGGGPDNETTMVGLLIFNRAFKYFEYGEACAQAILLTIVIAIFTIVQFKVNAADVEY